MTVKIAAASAVATATASNGIPAADRIAGLTKTMYAIVRNVTPPPSTSRRTVDPRLRISKKRSSPDSPDPVVAMRADATPYRREEMRAPSYGPSRGLALLTLLIAARARALCRGGGLSRAQDHRRGPVGERWCSTIPRRRSHRGERRASYRSCETAAARHRRRGAAEGRRRLPRRAGPLLRRPLSSAATRCARRRSRASTRCCTSSASSGLPSDKLSLRHGRLYRNGKRMDEPYTAPCGTTASCATSPARSPSRAGATS